LHAVFFISVNMWGKNQYLKVKDAGSGRYYWEQCWWCFL